MSDRLSLELEPADTLRLANLCGQFDAHLKQIESRVGVEIFCRGNLFTIQGPERASRAARRLLINLYRLAENEVLTPDLVNLHLQAVTGDRMPEFADPAGILPGEAGQIRRKVREAAAVGNVERVGIQRVFEHDAVQLAPAIVEHVLRIAESRRELV